MKDKSVKVLGEQQRRRRGSRDCVHPGAILLQGAYEEGGSGNKIGFRAITEPGE